MVILIAPSAAHAAVSGASQDVQGDVGGLSTPSGMPGGYMRDNRSYELSHDRETGTLEAQVRFWDTEPVDSGYPWFTLKAAVGVHRGGRCDTGASGGVITLFRTPDDGMEPSGQVEATITGDRAKASGTYQASTGGWSYRVTDPRLRVRKYDCVSGIRLDHISASFDEVGGFCLSDTGRVACPRTRPTPPAGLRVLESGDGRVTLDWEDSPLDAGDAYQVYVDERPVDLSVPSSRFTVTGLRNDATYRFRVSVGHQGSYGDWTDAVIATPHPAAPTTGAAGGTQDAPVHHGPSAPGPGNDSGASATGTRSGAAGSETPLVAPTFRLLGKPSVRAFARSGLRVAVACAGGCVATARIVLSARAARTLKVSRTLARSTQRLRTGKEVPMRVRPSGRVSRRLLGLARLSTTIVLETKDSNGTVRRLEKRVTLRR